MSIGFESVFAGSAILFFYDMLESLYIFHAGMSSVQCVIEFLALYILNYRVGGGLSAKHQVQEENSLP